MRKGRITASFTSKIPESSLFWISFLFSFFYSAVRGIDRIGLPDGIGYIQQAKGILRGLTYILDNPTDFSHNMGFSFFLAIIFYVFHTSWLLPYKILMAVFHGVSTLLIVKICKSLGFQHNYVLCCGFVFALDPFLLEAASSVGTESMTTLFVLWACHFYLNRLETFGNTTFVTLIYCIVGVFSVTMRPNLIFPFILITILVIRKNSSHKYKLFSTPLFFSGFTFLFTLYEIVLWRINGAFVFLANYGGQGVAYMCSQKFVPQYLGIASAKINSEISDWANISNPVQTLLQLKFPNFSAVAIDREMYRAGISACLSAPLKSLFVLVIKFFSIWRPYTGIGAYGVKVFLFSIVLMLPSTMGTIFFLRMKVRVTKVRELKIFFLILCCGFIPSLMITTEQMRHRVAFAEGFFWIFSFAFIQFSRFKSKGISTQYFKIG